MKALYNIAYVCLSEFRRIFHDKGIMIFVFAVPLFYPLLYSYIYTNEQVCNIPVAVVDNSQSPLSRQIVRQLDATADVRVVSHCTDLAQAQELVRRQQAYGIIQIPATLESDIMHNRQSVIGLYCDMASMLYYKGLILAANNVVMECNKDIKVEYHTPATTDRQGEVLRAPITYDYVPMYNPQSGFAAFLIPPVLMLILQQTLLLGVGMATGSIRERSGGSAIPMGRQFHSPVQVVLGRALPYLLIYIVFALYDFAVVNRIFTLPQLGHYTDYILFMLPFLLACIFFAMTLSAFIYRREDAILLIVFMSVPFLFMSGISWPGSAMPEFWKWFSYLIPTSFGCNGYVRINSMGASLGQVRPEFIALCIQAGVYFLTATLFYRRQFRVRGKR